MKTRIISIAILLIVGVLFFSWMANNKAVPPEEVDVNAVRTAAVATYASSLTETLVAVPNASATPSIVEPTITSTAITVTLEPTLTPNPCYNLLYIEDVTIPDGTQMKAGEVFTKTWLVQNIGGCAWHAGFRFDHVGGDRMRGNVVILEESIQTGSKREISVQLTVPSGQNGLIQSSWRMSDETGNFFGDTLSVNIQVGSVTTPVATNTP